MATEADHVRNTIMFSGLTGRYYFVAKAKRLGGGTFRVVGRKVDITEPMKRYLQDERRAAQKKARRK